MNYKTRVINCTITFCVLAFCSIQVVAQNITARIDSFFLATGNDENINGNVLIAEKGKLIYQRSFGFADFEKTKRNKQNSSFNIASVTKTFTATAILQLREKGELQLDEFFIKYFPDFPYPAVTIRNLLSHTSGLADLEIFFEPLNKEPGRIFTNADVIPCLKLYNKPLKFQPGDDWNYCNTNYELLALLVEKIGQQSFASYLQQHIFLPAGMINTYIETEKINREDTMSVKCYMPGKLYQSTYMPVDSVASPMIHYILDNFSGLQGQGMIVSTLPDLLKYDNALYTGKLLSNTSLKEAFTPVTLNKEKDYNASLSSRLGKAYYGLGWEIYADSSMGKVVSHGGSYPGIMTLFLRNVSKKQTIILFDNTNWTGIFFMGHMALRMLNEMPVINLLPKKSIARVYGLSLMENGSETAINSLLELRTDTIHYTVSEKEFNTLGYQFLMDGYIQKAVETFRLNSLLFPASFNVYDSYADALVKNNQKDAAIVMYRKSLSLNPGYEEAKNKLNKLLENK
ncbi:beta-lactamase family protein [Pseudoflavitalea sp. X16]|uniref:serine hydrolase domain-containing protein n=1 Tax=Paraflavitalea devenefica TaxID=2716334 RepID=UPI00141DCFD1|nr:serine hydrolase domain-containing protein [Paraflavitalea devenefica]NII28639.1 beta-lactamase family protein [Paraflavitalea devenefica]